MEEILKEISNTISKNIDLEKSGNCMIFAERFNEFVLENRKDLIDYYKIVEGYVSSLKYKEIILTHTWIELNSGEKIDPTFRQFYRQGYNEEGSIFGEFVYMKKVKKKYTPLEYRDLCRKTPLIDKKIKSFKEF